MSAPSNSIKLETLFSNYLDKGFQMKSVRIERGAKETTIVVWNNVENSYCSNLFANICYAFSCGSCGSPPFDDEVENGVRRRSITLLIEGEYHYNDIQTAFVKFQQNNSNATEATSLLLNK